MEPPYTSSFAEKPVNFFRHFLVREENSQQNLSQSSGNKAVTFGNIYFRLSWKFSITLFDFGW